MATTPHAAGRPGREASRLDVGVISAGRVGAALGAALARSGHNVVAVAAVSARSKDRAHHMLPQARVLPADEVAARASLLVVAVPDDAITDLVAGLANAGHLQPGQLIFHTSGAHGLDVLRPAAAVGALPMALHPAMTFTGRAEDLDRLSGACFAVTAPEALQPIAAALVVEMSGEPQIVAEADRAVYHAALCHGANHLHTLVSDAVDMLRVAGVADPRRLIAPVLSASLDNTLRFGDDALTGPVVRGDAGTVATHLEALAERDADTVDVYRAMARRTADRAIEAGTLTAETAEPLLGVLADRSPGEPS